MMAGSTVRWLAVAGVGAVALALATTPRWPIQAQDRVGRPGAKPRAAQAQPQPAPAPVSAQDALLRPFDFPFREPTPLADAAAQISRTLGVPVALDQAALDRQDVADDEPVKLELAGVRLKTGLKLLLDPLGLTVRVVPEDNLLIVTDAEGSEDPATQALAEIKAMHREIHDLQDAVDDLRDLVEEELGFEPEADPHRPSLVGRRTSPRNPIHAHPTRGRSRP